LASSNVDADADANVNDTADTDIDLAAQLSAQIHASEHGAAEGNGSAVVCPGVSDAHAEANTGVDSEVEVSAAHRTDAQQWDGDRDSREAGQRVVVARHRELAEQWVGEEESDASVDAHVLERPAAEEREFDGDVDAVGGGSPIADVDVGVDSKHA